MIPVKLAAHDRSTGTRMLSVAVQTCLLVLLPVISLSGAHAQGDAKRGQYLVKAGGCVGCHTEDKKGSAQFAGGRALKTPFGTFYGPNITPHPEAGIGRWTEADFIRAMRHGERPDGENYFPAFPYPSFTRIADGDLRDLWAYLQTLTPSDRRNQAHDLGFPFSWRLLVTAWKWLYFTPGPVTVDKARAPNISRGAYLVETLGHCGECHTPRNFLGGPRRDRFLAGGKGPEGKGIPNLTPTRLKKLKDAELKDFLLTGITADGDVAAESMGEVVTNTTSQLTPEDLAAMISYLRTLPELPDEKR
jgi:mono/diheme cytochrome c family protein